jgi:hypothetical protein
MDFRGFAARAALFCLFTAAPAFSSLAETPELPETVQVPKVHAAPAGNIMPRRPGDTPMPEPRPDRVTGEAPDATQSPAKSKVDAKGNVETPAIAPVPHEPPERGGAAPKAASPPDPRSGRTAASVMPLAEIACRQRLQDLGVEFDNRPAETSDSGCSLPYPVVVRGLGGGVALRPEALMNCALAESAARFAGEIAAPAAKREFGADLKAIDQASAYVCRPRNGSSKLSEHAFGNALDIARFELSDGAAVDVILRPEEREARFLGALRKSACGPFKTVLGPGSDADHALHFHLDLAPRRNGGTVCQ